MMRAVKSAVVVGLCAGEARCGQGSCDRLRILDEELASYKHAFDRDGFVVVRNFLSPDEIAEAFTHLAGIVSEPGPKKDVQKQDPWFDHLMERGRPRALVETMVAGPVQSASAGYFDKPLKEHHFAEIAPHVDGLGRRDGATVWVALDRVTKENGALFYVNGSHQMQLTPELIAATGESSEGAFCAEVNPGDAIVHTARTIHFSRRAQTTDPRRAVNFFYWTGLSKSDIALPYVDEKSQKKGGAKNGATQDFGMDKNSLSQKKVGAKNGATQDFGMDKNSLAWKKLVAQKEKMVEGNRWQSGTWDKMVAEQVAKNGKKDALVWQ